MEARISFIVFGLSLSAFSSSASTLDCGHFVLPPMPMIGPCPRPWAHHYCWQPCWWSFWAGCSPVAEWLLLLLWLKIRHQWNPLSHLRYSLICCWRFCSESEARISFERRPHFTKNLKESPMLMTLPMLPLCL